MQRLFAEVSKAKNNCFLCAHLVGKLKDKTLNNNRQEKSLQAKMKLWGHETISLKGHMLEAALIMSPLASVLNDPIQTESSLTFRRNWPTLHVCNITKSVTMGSNLLSQTSFRLPLLDHTGKSTWANGIFYVLVCSIQDLVRLRKTGQNCYSFLKKSSKYLCRILEVKFPLIHSTIHCHEQVSHFLCTRQIKARLSM